MNEMSFSQNKRRKDAVAGRPPIPSREIIAGERTYEPFLRQVRCGWGFIEYARAFTAGTKQYESNRPKSSTLNKLTVSEGSHPTDPVVKKQKNRKNHANTNTELTTGHEGRSFRRFKCASSALTLLHKESTEHQRIYLGPTLHWLR